MKRGITAQSANGEASAWVLIAVASTLAGVIAMHIVCIMAGVGG